MGITDAQRQALRSIREVTGEIGRYEIAATQLINGQLVMYFDHGRITLDRRGRHIHQNYGPIRLFGLIVGNVERPVDHLA
jgi:hypothetical protein